MLNQVYCGLIVMVSLTTASFPPMTFTGLKMPPEPPQPKANASKPTKGDILVVDGYFVHFIAPDSLPQTLPKDIIFVLDVSGSMSGKKIEQLKVAMKTILSDLKSKDRFNIITFSSGTFKWMEGLVDADETNVAAAQRHVEAMTANGMTNINAALLKALAELKFRQDKNRVGMVFFLTDGNPTQGETDAEKIARNVLNANEGTAAIFSLAFGDGADYVSLKTLSAQNLGFARKIYEAADADLQVSSLYDEISAVSIKDMSIKYQNSSVDEFTLTETEFPIVFNGSEIMVCGFLTKDFRTLKYEISGLESLGEVDISAEVDSVDVMIVNQEEQTDKLFTGPRDFAGMVERMWAYQTIRQLLRQKQKDAGDIGKVKKLDKKILELSLKYKFVTPLTSMVVTKPDKGETEIREADLDDRTYEDYKPMRSSNFQSRQGLLKHNPMPSMRKVGASSAYYGPMFDPVPGFASQNSMRGKVRHNKKKMTTTTTTTTTSSPIKLPKSSTTTKPKVQGTIQYSTLKLVTVTKHPDASPYICMVPKHWSYGNIVLFAGQNKIQVLLKLCPKRQCKKQPSLRSLKFSSGRTATEVQLNGDRQWRYRSSAAFHVSVMSNNKLEVSSPDLNATIEWTQQGQVAEYKVGLTLKQSKKDSGLFGALLPQSAQHLKSLRRRMSKRVCKDVNSAFSVLINRRKAKMYSPKNQRKTRRNRNSRLGKKRSTSNRQ
ncbi:inter-alpha-trypsin inhibitor heavy chain H3 [Elysia marginata]|uniref:Inter-alpha-trypsin inhibitor heavy chain H3 n=1 Tax=Elysia marginata TaxID=1093978 RepID=A0AAV4GVX4_9GAST|nr:inter-alpha-trypsin inhibitor heavy chain H3 [Elysia marginata]